MGPLQNKVLFVRSAVTIGLVTLALSGLFSSSDAAPGTPASVARLPVIHQGQTPLAFVENRGQVDPRVEFYLKTPGQVVWVTRDGVVFDLVRQGSQPDRGRAAAGQAAPLSGDQTPPRRRSGSSSPRTWWALISRGGSRLARRGQASTTTSSATTRRSGGTGVRAYADVMYRDVSGRHRPQALRQRAALEQEFVVRPGADPGRVQVAYRGIDGLDDRSLTARSSFKPRLVKSSTRAHRGYIRDRRQARRRSTWRVQAS